MENDEINNEKIMNEIGYLAYIMDTEMTIFERMKIKKSTLKRILIALGIYFTTITIFVLIL